LAVSVSLDGKELKEKLCAADKEKLETAAAAFGKLRSTLS
jgi:hypothetical protein